MTALDAGTAPDLADAIEAWRVWRVVPGTGGHQLRSVVKPTLWPRDAPLVAECLLGGSLRRRLWRRSPGHDSPSAPCDCGIYGADLGLLGQYLTPPPMEPTLARVLGRVLLWGTVVECERGYRASHAYPAAIYVPSDAACDGGRLEELACGLAGYGVPIELLIERCLEAPSAVARLVGANL